MSVVSSNPARTYVEAQAGQVPAALIERVQSILAADPGASGLSVSEALLRASTSLLGAVLADEAAGREVALDLLAADACVTWAFEAAAAEPATLPKQAEDAMQRIAELAR